MTTKSFLRRARSSLRTTTANKLIATLAVLGAAASIAGLATFATFTSTTSSSHTISSGTVTIALGATGASTNRLNIGASAIAPGDTIQRSGVGARLIRDALGRAEEAGEPAVMVEGIPAYYPRFGFEQACALGFISPHPRIPDDAFMVKRLPGYSPDLAGRIVYPAAFDALGY